MADRVEEVAGKLAKIGISQIPVVGLVAQVVDAFLPPGADARLKVAVESELQEDVLRLQARVEKLELELGKQGKRLDELGAVRTVRLGSEVLRDVTAAGSRIKQNALINAAAHQFDPTVGGEATRKFWYDVLREMSDIQIFAFRLVADNEPIAMIGDDMVAFGVGLPRPVDLQNEHQPTLRTTLAILAEAPELAAQRTILFETGAHAIDWRGAARAVSQRIVLSPGGKILAKLIAD